MSPGSYPWSLSACWSALTWSALTDMLAPPRPPFAARSPFIESVSDFIVSDGFVASCALVSLGLADGDVALVSGPAPVFVSVPVADGELPLVSPLLLPAPVCPCASAGAAANARATPSANAPIHAFIVLASCCCVGFPRRLQLAWRRSATGLRKSCSAGGASIRAILGSVTGRPSRAER